MNKNKKKMKENELIKKAYEVYQIEISSLTPREKEEAIFKIIGSCGLADLVFIDNFILEHCAE